MVGKGEKGRGRYVITNKNGRFHCIFCIFLLHLGARKDSKSIADIVKISIDLKSTLNFFMYSDYI